MADAVGFDAAVAGPGDDPRWLLQLHAHWYGMRWPLGIGAVAIVAGGLVAAASAPAHSELGAWSAAYLVLVGGVAQIAIALAQALLSLSAADRESWRAQVLLWNAGNAAVIAGTVAGAQALVDAGGLLLLVALALSAREVRAARGRGPRLYAVGLAALAVSVVVGLVVARVHPLA